MFSTAETGLPYITQAGGTVNGGTVGFPYASFLLGLADQVRIAPPNTIRLGKHQLGFFAQDTWKVTRKLTLDYGMRYDYSTYLREQYGRLAQFSPTTSNPSIRTRTPEHRSAGLVSTCHRTGSMWLGNSRSAGITRSKSGWPSDLRASRRRAGTRPCSRASCAPCRLLIARSRRPRVGSCAISITGGRSGSTLQDYVPEFRSGPISFGAGFRREPGAGGVL